ncbi:MAG: MltA domain-containing protein [Pseudomonadota bacterium]
MRYIGLFLLILLSLSACETAPRETPEAGATAARGEVPGEAVWQVPPRPVAFDRLPGWDRADLAPGLSALRRSCARFAERPAADRVLSRAAPWAGTPNDWQPACAALDVIQDERSARAVLQALFSPVLVTAPQGTSRFTGYFEPTYEARLTPQPPFTEAIPARPDDLISRGDRSVQLLPDGSERPYPTRAEITRSGVEALAYARPSDVFFLQIQGSGRLILPDGRTLRTVFAAHNGHPFVSTANWLIRRGWITRSEASMAGIKAWMARAPAARVREAMNANPRFVFFNIEPEGDPDLGPKGAFGVPLTPLGSIAVDRRYHALGVPMFVRTTAPGLGGVWSGFVVAQDTGGAIQGPVRGDLYLGTGPDAGARADTINAPGEMWVLLPRALAERIRLRRDAGPPTTRPRDQKPALGLTRFAP